MGQKVKPIGLRFGINRTWDSRWYAGRNYGELLHKDIELRSYLMERLKQAAISRVVIERPAGRARITIHAGRPGLIIGKKGQDIERLRAELSKRVGSEVSLNIVEVRKPEIDAKLIAENIAQQLERQAKRLGGAGWHIDCHACGWHAAGAGVTQRQPVAAGASHRQGYKRCAAACQNPRVSAGLDRGVSATPYRKNLSGDCHGVAAGTWLHHQSLFFWTIFLSKLK